MPQTPLPLCNYHHEICYGTIQQGFLESSNVDIADEMVNMIIGQRAYEANSKTILTVDNMLSLVNNLKR